MSKPKQTPKEKAIELFKSYEGCNVWVNFSAGVKEIINEALDIAIEEAEKQGYEKLKSHLIGGVFDIDTFKIFNDLLIKVKQEGAEQKAKEIFDDIYNEMGKDDNSVLYFSGWDKLKQKHFSKEVKNG